MVLCQMVNTESVVTSKEELTEAESKDKLEIVKQIKKVNDDGSYTIGYEADDGSFKIESRDIQGNIKGTYGYVDDDGEVKRVSYSTTNTSSELSNPISSVVQRIPRINRNFTTTSTSPTVLTLPTVASSTVVQSIPRRRIAPTSATKLNQTAPTIITAQQYHQRSAASQIARPEFATAPPLIRRPTTQTSSLNEGIKPVTEQSEIHGNLLRRQTFNVQQHAANLRQSHGSDSPDVYTASVTTGMPRPLFTTVRPATVESSSVRYTPVYTPELTTLSPSTQESSTEAQYTTPVSTNPVQIPPNQLEPLVAIRHPYRGTIVVPLRELQAREQIEPIPYSRNQPVYSTPQREETDPRTVPVYVRRPPVQILRSMPVQIDENGYVRELRPIPYAQPPQYLNSIEDNIDNDIDSIKPPVSVNDFQKLLNLLIIRQKKLEQVNRLSNMHQQYENVYQAANPVPYVVQNLQQRGPVQFSAQNSDQRRFYTPQPYQQSNRRVARLLKPSEIADDYLPPDVREMLLLRMLQLAINPALPVDDIESLGSSTNIQMTKQPVRNVEILGEEPDMMRVKRFQHNT